MNQKSIKKNTLYSIIKTGSSLLFPLITFPYATRVLLTENVGKINFGLSIVSYFSLIASLGITTYAIRECSGVRNDKEKLSKTASQIWSINIFSTLVAYLALIVTLFFWRKLDNYRVLIMIQSISILATTLGADWLNSAMEDFKYITVRTVAFQIVSLVLMFIFVHKPDDYMKYVIICLVSVAGANITNVWYRKRYCRVVFTCDVEWKKHIAPIMYLLVMLLAQTIFNSVDSTMLGLFCGDHEVGIYSVAHKILNIINQLISAILWVILPRMSYYFAEKDYNEINALLRKILGFNILLGFPCALGCFLIAKDVILVISGAAFIEAVPVLQIFMVGFAISLFGGSFLGNAILLPSKKEKYYMVVCCIAAVINVIGNYIFIPMFGAKAAAATTLVCSFIILILLLFKIDKNVKISRVLNLLLAPVVGCIGITIVCFLTRNIPNLWIRIIVCISCSIGIYLMMQIALRNELVIELIQSVKKKLRQND